MNKTEKMNKATILCIVGLLLVGVIAVGAFAMPFGKEGKGMFGNNDAAKEALAAGDYDAFVSAVQDSGKMQDSRLTEEQFNKMVEQNKAMEEKRAAMQEQMGAVNAAVESGDYAAWQEAISSMEHKPVFAEKITEENFGTYVQLQQKLQEARALAEELGIDGPGIGHGIGSPGMGMQTPGMEHGREGMGRMGHRMDSFGPEMPAE